MNSSFIASGTAMKSVNWGSKYFSKSSTDRKDTLKKWWWNIKTSTVFWLQMLTEVLTFLVKDLDTLSLVGCVCQSSTDPCEWFSTLTEGKKMRNPAKHAHTANIKSLEEMLYRKWYVWSVHYRVHHFKAQKFHVISELDWTHKNDCACSYNSQFMIIL